MNNKKKFILGSIIGLFIGSLLGISYAMFTYNSSSINNKLIAGDIYMRYKETSAINLNGAMPSATYPDSTSGNYFEFQIVGKNTSTKDITYNVKLAYGDSIQGKDRITDSHLVFKLVEVVNNEEQTPALVTDQSFNSIPGATLYTATIPHGTNNETTRTFRVYARISEEVGIGTNTTYTIQEWNNLYASIKINVDGGFTGGGSQPSGTNGAQMLMSTYGTSNSGGLVGINKNGGLYNPTATGTSNNTNNTSSSNLVNKNNEVEARKTDANDTKIREYRYSGVNDDYDINNASPEEEPYSIEPVKNYIWFNDELWRIVGIFDKIDDEFGNGNDEPVIKIVKDTPIESAPTSYTNKQGDTAFRLQNGTQTWAGVQVSRMYWNKTGGTRANLNDWSEAGLQYYLNEENSTSSNSYYDTMNGSYKGFIDGNTTYYLGKVNSESTPSNAYTQERDTSSGNLWSGNPGTWTGKIGLLYPSDFGYATDSTVWNGTTTEMEDYGNVSNIKTRNWILKLCSYFSWFLSPSYSDKNSQLTWSPLRRMVSDLNNLSPDGMADVYPVLSLKSDTVIVSGEGTSENPYRLIAV